MTSASLQSLEWLTGRSSVAPAPFTVEIADSETARGRRLRADYARLRRQVFVDEQGLFAADDADEADLEPRTVVLVAVAAAGVDTEPTVTRQMPTWAGGRAVGSSCAPTRDCPARESAAPSCAPPAPGPNRWAHCVSTRPFRSRENRSSDDSAGTPSARRRSPGCRMS
jgi:hypothetical protein